MQSISQKIVLTLVLVLSSSQVGYSKTYKIGHFSDQYFAIIDTVESQSPQDDDAMYTDYQIKIFQQDKAKPIIIQDSSLSEYDFETVDKTGKILPNIAELPYGHQSVLIYNDFNFDGKQDLALKDGNESCYGGSSFQVYTATDNGFELNQGLSDLAHNKCGMFGTDNKQKLIYTMTKSGCCYHEYDTYGIINNSPSLQQHIVESVMTYMPDFFSIDKFDYPKNPKQPIIDTEAKTIKEENIYLLNVNNDDVLMRFKLKDKDKYAVIYKTFADEIDYALLDTPLFPLIDDNPNDDKEPLYKGDFISPKVDFSYLLNQTGYIPDNATRQANWQKSRALGDPIKFFVDVNDKHHLSFKNGNKTYIISDDKLGITVKENGKSLFLAGDKATQHGKIADLFDPETDKPKTIYQNLVY